MTKQLTKSQLLINRLEDAIISGKYKIGDKLPSEREFSTQMEMSKTNVHNAITELERKGFVEVKPRVGYFVGDFLRNGQIDTFFSLLRYNGGVIDKKFAESIVNLRKYIEIPSISAAVETINEEKLATLKVILDDALTQSQQKNVGLFAVDLFKFSREVCILSGNLISPMLFNAFSQTTLVFWEKNIQIKGYLYSENMLKGYYEAIANKDALKAIEIVKFDLNDYNLLANK